MVGPEPISDKIYSCTNQLMVICKSWCGSSSCKEAENRQDVGGGGGRFDVWVLSANVIQALIHEMYMKIMSSQREYC